MHGALAHPEKFRSACSRSSDGGSGALRARGFIPSRLKSFVSADVFSIRIVRRENCLEPVMPAALSGPIRPTHRNICTHLCVPALAVTILL